MQPNKSSATTSKKKATGASADVTVDLYPFIRKYKDGCIERFLRTSFVPASDDTATDSGMATRDVLINRRGVSARMFLPAGAVATGGKLPVVTYIRGSTFYTESAFSKMYHRYATFLAAHGCVLVVSVDYRLAPEHPIPTAYDDAWAALHWVVSTSYPWLATHDDPKHMFIAGDSAGSNIVYQMAVRASRGADVMDLERVILVHPYFLGAERLPAEAVYDGVSMFMPEFVDKVWPFETAGQASNNDPRLNPSDEEIKLFTRHRALVAVASKDIFRNRARRLAA